MKKRLWKVGGWILLVGGLLCLGGNVFLLLAGGRFSLNLPVRHTAEFSHPQVSQFPARLEVKGNRIINEQGQDVILRGLMPADPAVLRSRAQFNRAFFAAMAETGANVIRIPIHPENWVHDPDYLRRYLDPIVGWAGELGVYVILDWHYIGNVESGTGSQMPDLDIAPKTLTLEFWQHTARYFRNAPHVIFEIFNEPQSISAEVWSRNAQEIVTHIRAQEADQLVIVGGIAYGRDLAWVSRYPIRDSNVAYASHIYPSHPRSGWEHWFGAISQTHPVVITEWGYMETGREPSQSYLIGDENTYATPLLSYLEARQIGWVACWYDDDWLPPMFETGWKGYTPFGEFIIRQLNAYSE